MPVPTDRPDVHYDNVTAAWRYWMGESFHYGLFKSPQDSLSEATEAFCSLSGTVLPSRWFFI